MCWTQQPRCTQGVQLALGWEARQDIESYCFTKENRMVLGERGSDGPYLWCSQKWCWLQIWGLFIVGKWRLLILAGFCFLTEGEDNLSTLAGMSTTETCKAARQGWVMMASDTINSTELLFKRNNHHGCLGWFADPWAPGLFPCHPVLQQGKE